MLHAAAVGDARGAHRPARHQRLRQEHARHGPGRPRLLLPQRRLRAARRPRPRHPGAVRHLPEGKRLGRRRAPHAGRGDGAGPALRRSAGANTCRRLRRGPCRSHRGSSPSRGSTPPAHRDPPARPAGGAAAARGQAAPGCRAAPKTCGSRSACSSGSRPSRSAIRRSKQRWPASRTLQASDTRRLRRRAA